MANPKPAYRDDDDHHDEPLDKAVHDDADSPDAPLPSTTTSSSSTSTSATSTTHQTNNKQGSPQWLTYAIVSGGCAALNGVFAKLTTTTSTQSLATHLAHILGLSSAAGVVEVALRGIFFTLNLLSNATMWFLFTRALTLATSTTRVAVLNTSSNFIVTAVLGMLVFGEGLPLLWWCGAALLVAGSVVIGRRDEGSVGKGGDAAVQGDGGIVLEGTSTGFRDESEGEGDEGSETLAEERVKTKGKTGKVVKDKISVEEYTDGTDEEEVWREQRSK